MNKFFGILIIGIVLFGCKQKSATENAREDTIGFNQELANELENMAEIDQLVASNAFPPENYSYLTSEQWKIFKDSVFLRNQKRAKEILNTYGFVGFDLAGEKGSRNFWLIVQHSDHNPEFQKEVLKEMKKEVDKQNAISTNYGLLVDRVNLNTGHPQIYGTQVTYNINNGQAYPKTLMDSINVNSRRKSIGLEPIEEYLNGMSEMHFEMNKANYLSKGITEPTLYITN
ncbi:DUF6624 domain-containing protein [Formosa algae]|uniref:Uncharacterized protein n=1 Tax=Formosa algae TaxID=225843 RepID=A0A9X0YLH9_9FLAO|nr:DUF6624 domain-containing protein [Formosa algae]MBP1840775.1 hypothetical protein [Formosa algae]MDQ0336328.1 hypothetical protein [Formosa algae]OEI79290.1 hypothetical protein AST99_15235 [Formosa algae]